MSGRLGVELLPDRLRAVLTSALRDQVTRTADVAWDPARPREGVRALREALGISASPDAIALAVGVSLLHVARVALPPAPDESREAMLALEPARYLATTERVVTAVAPGSEMAFALGTSHAEAWGEAFGEWAPVERIEPAPCAIARALGGAATGTFLTCGDDTSGEHGVIELRDGHVVRARRVPSTLDEVAASALPRVSGVTAEFVAALGAARSTDAQDAGMLATAAQRRVFRGRRLRRLTTAGIAAAAAIAFAVVAFDHWRERTLAALEAEAARLAVQARPALEAQARLSNMEVERAALSQSRAQRLDQGASLAAISHALPKDAVILSARATGDEWRLDGTAANAAALVPALDQTGAFENVRSLAASSRFQDGARMRETFSIAFRVHPKP